MDSLGDVSLFRVEIIQGIKKRPMQLFLPSVYSDENHLVLLIVWQIVMDGMIPRTM